MKKRIIFLVISSLVFIASIIGILGTEHLKNLSLSETAELELTLTGVKATPVDNGCFVQLMVDEYDTVFRHPQFSEEIIDEDVIKSLKPGDKISIRIPVKRIESIDKIAELEFVEFSAPTGMVLSFEQYHACQLQGWLPMQFFIGIIGGISAIVAICFIRTFFFRKKAEIDL